MRHMPVNHINTDIELSERPWASFPVYLGYFIINTFILYFRYKGWGELGGPRGPKRTSANLQLLLYIIFLILCIHGAT